MIWMSAWTLVTAHDFHHSHLHVSFSDMQKNPKHMSGCAGVFSSSVTGRQYLYYFDFFQGFAWTFRWKKRILNVITHTRLTFPAYIMSIPMALLYLSVPVCQDSMWNGNQMEFGPCSFNYSHFCSYCDMQNSRPACSCVNIMFLLLTATVISNEVRTDTPDRMEVWMGTLLQLEAFRYFGSHS